MSVISVGVPRSIPRTVAVGTLGLAAVVVPWVFLVKLAAMMWGAL